jgi:hypothetical protein
VVWVEDDFVDDLVEVIVDVDSVVGAIVVVATHTVEQVEVATATMGIAEAPLP